MLMFGAGYVAMFAVFALLHRHALRQCADALALDDVELLDTRFAIIENVGEHGRRGASVAVTCAVA